jgi:transcriptional regulator of arginine metabolism
MAANGDKRGRHEAIRRLINDRMIGTQEDLVRLLAGEGFQVTQATLSRDLATLHAARIPRPDEEGGPFYEIHEPDAEPIDFARLRELGLLVRKISDNDALVVVRTMPGAAQAVAVAIDEAPIAECLGSIAGDDTIFITPRRGTSTRRLTRRLQELLLNGARG